MKLTNGWTVCLHNHTEETADLSGNIYFAWGEDEWDDNWFGEALYFCCGPETKDGYLSDYFDFYGELRKILPFASIGIAENEHAIIRADIQDYFTSSFSVEEVKKIVFDTLERNGIYEN